MKDEKTQCVSSRDEGRLLRFFTEGQSQATGCDGNLYQITSEGDNTAPPMHSINLKDEDPMAV